MTNEAPSLTEQLNRYAGEEREIAEAILREVLPELHRVALAELHREHFVSALSPTELINEVWTRSLHKGKWQVNNRSHFYAIAAIAMRRVLIDLARRRMADRHGAGVQTLSLEEPTVQEPSTASPESIVAVGLLMDRFDQIDPQAAHVVNMIYFAGFSVQEVAAHTGWSERQVRSRWKKAQNWLKDRL